MRTILFTLLFFSAGIARAQQDFYIKFPDDVRWTSCPLPLNGDYGAPQIFNANGDTLVVSYHDAIIDVVPDACYTIERIWLIEGPAFDPMLPCTDVPNPYPVPIVSDPANLPGPVVSPAGTAAPWEPTVVKVQPSDPAPTDFSIYWSATPNCYSYKQNIKIIDTADPVVADCPVSTLVFDDSTSNNGQLWNELFWINPVTNSTNLSEMPVPLSITVSDACTGAQVGVYYLLFLDLDQDGIMETVVSSNNVPAAGQVNFGNAFNPNFGGGIPRDFDERPVPAEQKYRFGLQQTVDSLHRICRVGWNTSSAPNNWALPELPPGLHKIKWIVTDGCGNDNICEYTFTVIQNTAYLRTLTGKVAEDVDLDCLASPDEPDLKGWRAKIESLGAGGISEFEQYSAPDAGGYFHFLLDSGDYRLVVTPPNDYWGGCAPDTTFTVQTIGDTTETNFAVQALTFCPFLETDIGIWGLRRCFNNTYTVRYCNTGPVAAENAYIRVRLDPSMSFVNAGLPGVEEGNQVWRFDLGNISTGDCGSFPLTVYLDCNSTVLGQTHCVEAHIYPDSVCLENSWNGALVEVDGACHPDSVRFKIRNAGNAPSSLLEYIVIEDNIINFQGTFQLPAGDSMMVSVPANGSTWRLEAEQEPGSPGNPMPSATVEACGQNTAGFFSIGYVSQFGESDADPFISVDCQQNQGAYDPNDKQGFPLGYGDEHRILPGEPLEYRIRFQNTGTDTAFTVVVLDTLASWLDPASVLPGAASHPYRFELTGRGVLRFYFDNILLPDSNVNEAASHGFVKFRVQQRPDVPPGTIIANRAAIYFDFNAPVLTNETTHLIDLNFVITDVENAEGAGVNRGLQVWPNPAGNQPVLYLQHLSLTEGLFELYDGQGRLRLRSAVAGDQVPLGAAPMPGGLYFFRITGNGVLLGAGKIMFQ